MKLKLWMARESDDMLIVWGGESRKSLSARSHIPCCWDLSQWVSLLRVHKHRRILIVPVSQENHLCLVLTLLHVVQFATRTFCWFSVCLKLRRRKCVSIVYVQLYPVWRHQKHFYICACITLSVVVNKFSVDFTVVILPFTSSVRGYRSSIFPLSLCCELRTWKK